MQSLKKIQAFLVSALILYGFQVIGADTQFLDSLQNHFFVAECCSTNLSSCAREKPHCAKAADLLAFSSWLKELGRSTDEKIAEALLERYQMYYSPDTFTIDTSGWTRSGETGSKLLITEYFSASCPMCKYTYREIHNAVTTGVLKGKAYLMAKPLTTGIGDKALMAAQEMNSFPEFMLALEEWGGRPDEMLITAIADSLGLDTTKFKSLLNDKALNRKLNISSHEAKKNGVKVTPTFFIGNKRYSSYKDPKWVLKAVEVWNKK